MPVISNLPPSFSARPTTPTRKVSNPAQVTQPQFGKTINLSFKKPNASGFLKKAGQALMGGFKGLGEFATTWSMSPPSHIVQSLAIGTVCGVISSIGSPLLIATLPSCLALALSISGTFEFLNGMGRALQHIR